MQERAQALIPGRVDQALLHARGTVAELRLGALQFEQDEAGLLRVRAAAQQDLAEQLGDKGIAQLGTRFRIPLFNHFYSQR